MSTDTTSTAAVSPPPATGTTFELKVTNNSSISGDRYFSVYPPILTNIAAKSQLLMPLSSDPTSPTASTAIITWQGGNGALMLFAFSGDTDPSAAPKVPVALGDTVAIDWANGAFTLTPAAGGPSDGIEVTFKPAVPTDTKIGVVVGPGAILVAPPAGQAPLTLTPDLSLTATVVFGTPYQWPESEVSDLTKPQAVIFKPDSGATSPTATAAIVVGLDNTIVEGG